MKTSVKVAAYSVILAVDLAFFLFFPTQLPEYYDQIFRALPWSDALEMTFLLISGLLIAIIVSVLLVRLLTKSLLSSVQRGYENE